MVAKRIKSVDTHYRYSVPLHVTVQVDTREKYPVLFPDSIRIPHPEREYRTLLIKVITEKRKLDIGDYRLKEYPNCCVVERKASQLELFKNVMNCRDSVRQAKAFRKLSTVQHPVILIEASPSSLMQKSKRIPDPELLISKLTMVLSKYGFQTLWIPWKSRIPEARRKLGTFLAHLMLNYAIQPQFDVLPELVYDPKQDGEIIEGAGDADTETE